MKQFFTISSLFCLLFASQLSAQTSSRTWNTGLSSSGKAYMGIHYDNIDEEKAKKLSFDNSEGYYITKVSPNSAAEKAGLMPFDYIYKIDNQEFTKDNRLSEVLSEYKPDDKVTVYFYRKGKKQNKQITLGSTTNRTFAVADPMQKAFMGIRQDDNEDESCIGVQVEIVEDAPAEQMGLEDGDIITSINRFRVVDWGDISAALATVDLDKEVKVSYVRNEKRGQVSGLLMSKSERLEYKTERLAERSMQRAEKIEERTKERVERLEERAKEYQKERKEDCQQKQQNHNDHAFLGIHSDRISAKKAKYLGFDNPHGSYVTNVLGNTAAQESGIEIFDYIYGVDEYRVGENQSLGNILYKYHAGDKAEVKLIRQGKKVSKTVTFGRKDDAKRSSNSQCEQPLFGINQNHNGSSADNGVRVNVVENSTAQAMGLQNGTIIHKINDYPMYDWSDITTAIDDLKPGETIQVNYTMNGAKSTQSMPIKSYKETKDCDDCCDDDKNKTWGIVKDELDLDFDFDFNDNDIRVTWDDGEVIVERGIRGESRDDVSDMQVEMHELNSDEKTQMRSELGLDTDIANNLSISQLNVFPNPSTGLFNLQFDMPERGDTKVQIFNNAGRQIYSYELADFDGRFEDTVDISQNGAGNYFLAITQNGKTMTKKIVLSN